MCGELPGTGQSFYLAGFDVEMFRNSYGGDIVFCEY
jgi:hypothetical protein